MRHLATMEVDGGVKIQYDRGGTTPGDVLEYLFRRTVIGLSFPEPTEGRRGTGYGIAIVVGERVLVPNDPGRRARNIERFYVCLDEAEDTLSARLFDHIIRLKDKYRVSTIYCMPTPVALVEALKRHDGISYYWEKNPEMIRAMFPSFVSTKVTAGVHTVSGDQSAINRDIEAMLNAPVHDPDTGEIVRFLDYSFAPMPKLLFPDDLPTVQTRTGVSQATPEVTRALWCALTGLENSRGFTYRKPEQEIFSTSPTGY